MFCRNCGKELEGAPRICMHCGAELMAGTSFCPGCGAPTTSLTEVCINCGVRVAKVMKRKTWKPTAAGILCIIVGAIGVILGLVVNNVGSALAYMFGTELIAIGALLIIAGIIPIVGGIYALRRRIWGLALAGSIFALIVPVTLVILVLLFFIYALAADFYPPPDLTTPAMLARILSIWPVIVGLGIPGILAIIFVTKGKREFK